MLRTKTGLEKSVWRIQDSENRALIEHRPSGARIRCIGSDPKRAHGLRPYIALMDEPAQYDSAKADKMLAAIRTGLGKVPGSRLIALGTRPSDSTHWFARMLEGSADYAQVHAARDGDGDFAWRTIRRANPSIDHLPSLRERIIKERDDARRDETLLQSWRALRLNKGVSDVERSMLLSPGTWTKAERHADPEGSYALGIDVGSTQAMTAAAAYWPATGRLDAFAVFPGLPGLSERGLRDGVGDLYLRMERRDELVCQPGPVVDLQGFIDMIHGRWGLPSVIVADRYKEHELRAALDGAGWPMVDDLVFRGQGFKDGSEDVEGFRRATIGGRVRPVRSLLLRSAMAEAVTIADPAGNEKLSKATEGGRRRRARDDAAAAGILAVAEGERRRDDMTEDKPDGPRYFVA